MEFKLAFPYRATLSPLPLLLCLLACGPGGGDGAEYPAGEASADVPQALTGDYVGQPLPGATPELFAPGLITTGIYTRDVAITPDGSQLFFGVLLGRFTTILETHRGPDGQWSQPEVAPFARDSRFFALEPAIHPDGSRLMFLSTRIEGREPEAAEVRAWDSQDIWAVDRVGEGWGEAYSLGSPVNTEDSEYFPSITRDGTLYFTRAPREGGESYIYRSRLVDGEYQEPERLGPEVNSTPNQFNAFISPDESYLILCTGDREDGVGDVDYWVVFRNPDDSWVGPINMGEVVNTPAGGEFSPYVSPDGRYFFFMASRLLPDEQIPPELSWEFLWRFSVEPGNGNAGIYWMDASFIEELRPGG